MKKFIIIDNNKYRLKEKMSFAQKIGNQCVR